jgi:hypothetical protein
VRNRVALRRTHAVRAWAVRVTRAAIALVALPVLLLVATAQGAAAQESDIAEARVPFSIAGPVGIAAVVLGLGGLALGLLRLRRKTAQAETTPMEAVAPAPPVTPAVVAPAAVAPGPQTPIA